MRKILYVLTLLTLFFMTASAQKEKETIVKISTEYGDIKIKLYNDTPQHRDNFIKLIKDGFYNDLLFHRVIKGFMIQGGDPQSKNAPAGKQLGAGDVGYTIPAEFDYPKYYHKKGALAAARQGDQVNPQKRSSGCQFYIVQGKKVTDRELDHIEKTMQEKAKQARFYEIAATRQDEIQKLYTANDQAGLNKLQNEIIQQMEKEFSEKPAFKLSDKMRDDYKTLGGTPMLDNEYTVFGEVIDGLDVIDKIAAVSTQPGDRPTKDVKMKITLE
jgi:cyclophilin family peptidyl-prolyl cis-trans isomerase